MVPSQYSGRIKSAAIALKTVFNTAANRYISDEVVPLLLEFTIYSCYKKIIFTIIGIMLQNFDISQFITDLYQAKM